MATSALTLIGGAESLEAVASAFPAASGSGDPASDRHLAARKFLVKRIKALWWAPQKVEQWRKTIEAARTSPRADVKQLADELETDLGF